MDICFQDDINTVPFFDVKLPREVALIIFRHLDMNDLCTCSRVNIIILQILYLLAVQ